MHALPAIEAENDRILSAVRDRAKTKAPLAPADALTRAFATGAITPDRACESKRAYRTPDYAQRQADRIAKQYGRSMHIYHCFYCDCYHLATDKA